MRTLPLTAAVLAVVALAGCDLDPEAAAPPAPAVTVTETAPPPAAKTGPTVPVSPSPSKTAAKVAGKKRRVPNVVGHNHQAAQDELQAAGFFMLQEQDATGQNRLLLWDRNWVVVRQSPRAGARVSTDATITLYSKKKGE